MTRHTALPPGLLPRMLSLGEAAAYCGLGETAFLKEMAAGLFPGPLTLTGTRRRVWDVRLLDAAIDRAQGLGGGDDREARKRAYQERRKGRAQDAG